jgi:hypothetical protein
MNWTKTKNKSRDRNSEGKLKIFIFYNVTLQLAPSVEQKQILWTEIIWINISNLSDHTDLIADKGNPYWRNFQTWLDDRIS